MKPKESFRIVFMGSPDFAVPSLDLLHQNGFRVAGVVTGPDKKRGRGNELSPTPVKKKALELGLPVIEVEDLKETTFHNQLEELSPDLFVVVAFRVLPKSILQIPAIGSINLHASLLPKYRGAAPIHRAVMNGDAETGATIFFLDEKVDTGNYLMQLKTPIGSHETTGEVYNRLMTEGGRLLLRAVKVIRSGNYKLHQQDDTKATSAPKIFQNDCLVHFDRSCEAVHNQIRGLSPFPGAFTFLDGKRLKLYRSSPLPEVSLEVGQMKSVDHKLYIGCASGAVEILELQLEGKKTTDGASFVRGYSGAGKVGEQ